MVTVVIPSLYETKISLLSLGVIIVNDKSLYNTVLFLKESSRIYVSLKILVR